METAIKAAALALVACVSTLAMKKYAPEHALLLGVCTAGAICALALPVLGRVLELWREIAAAAELSGAVLTPVSKCVGLGLLTRLCADFCRDGGSSTTATAVELVGCVCALLAASPLMLMLLELIGGWI